MNRDYTSSLQPHLRADSNGELAAGSIRISRKRGLRGEQRTLSVLPGSEACITHQCQGASPLVWVGDVSAVSLGPSLATSKLVPTLCVSLGTVQ